MQRRDDAGLISRRFETFEDRLALSAQPVADIWLTPDSEQIVEPSSSVTLPLGPEGHGWTDVAAARDQYGLRGDHQTVAIIDSGIAYDHVALGGGLGKAYRVVGGWDFAENDANPYDDGPAGFHGTHVAGIVGAEDKQYAGVAPDVDLVALRVFDDQGNGQLTWVEQALRWVHQNRNTFANPITTVNLSLGTEWNSSSLPKWATFEDELKQLADDGILISVAAGNSFLVYNAPGLSYPAVSQYVTPVASVDAAGNLSRFSQRDSRVLAAPGEKIMSTLPDAFYGGDGIKNDWGAASGTSMAAPYVTGASVLVREAMQDLGFTQITQGTIYDLFRRTADSIYDATTKANYLRLNLQRALDTLVGPDDYGSTSGDATAVGQLTTSIQVSGTIGRTSDQDFFLFVAAKSGKATLTLSGPQDLAAHWQQLGGGKLNGNQLKLDIVAGQSYVVGVAGGGTSIGKYGIGMQLSAVPSGGGNSSGGGSSNNSGGSSSNSNGNSGGTAATVDWGTIEQSRFNDVAIRGSDAWFQVTAGRSGRFTAEAFFSEARGHVDVEIYDAQRRLLASGSGTSGMERADVDVSAGDRLFIRAKGVNPDVDFRLTNLVTVTGNSAVVSGTAGDDSLRWQAGGQQQLEINGVSYALAGVSQIKIDGRGGSDSLVLVGGSATESVNLRPGSGEVFGTSYAVQATNVERIHFVGGPSDFVAFYDSAGDDVFEARPGWMQMSGGGYQNSAEGVTSIAAVASGGYDLAKLQGSTGSDVLYIWGGTRTLFSSGATQRTEGFERVEFDGGAGEDRVEFYSANKSSRLYGRYNYGWVTDGALATQFLGVESVLASIRTSHKLQTDLAALDFVFRRIGRS